MPKARAKVAIVGASGMLGSMVLDVLERGGDVSLVATVRDPRSLEQARTRWPGIEWRLLDAERDDARVIARAIDGATWVVNAIGKTKPYTHDDNPREIENAIRVNSHFPFLLARAAEDRGARVIQIATDCAFSGSAGRYVESSKHDALDAYGKTKSLGECPLPNVAHLRCSIIGPEPKLYVFLLEWFRRQEPRAELKGYDNHLWNGITTYHFARLCHGMVRQGSFVPGVVHVLPAGTISKADLLECFKSEYDRPDVTIRHVEVVPVVDRTLATEHEGRNRVLWKAAGYERAPTIPEMVAELARYDYRMVGSFR